MEPILLGVTDRSILVFIPDPASTDGSGKTGLVAANLTVSYARVETDNDVTVTDVTSSLNDLSALTDAHNDWGLKEVSSTLAPGLYRLDVADAVFAAGAWYAVVYVMITTSAAAATPKAFQLVAWNPLDGTRLGLSALPNAAAEAAGGLYTRGSGAGQINQPANGMVDANVAAISGDAAAADNLEAYTDGTTPIPANATQISGDSAAADNLEAAADGSGYNLGGGSVVAASVTGAVGSVSGAVGSVTGNVGGNVTGTVGGFTAAAKAEIEAEVNDALIAQNLDHLLKVAVDTDFATTVHLNSVLGHLADNGTTATFDRTTDALEVLRDKLGDVETDTQDLQGRVPAALVGGRMDANVGALSGDATAADNAESFFDGTGYAGTNNVIPTVTTLAGHTPQTGDAFARLGAPAGASVSADVAAVKNDTAAIKAKTDLIPASPAAVGSAMTLTSGERDSVAAALLDLTAGVETGLTLRQALRLVVAASAGKLSGAATTTIVIRNTGDSKDRITATVDSSGNRSAVTYDLT